MGDSLTAKNLTFLAIWGVAAGTAYLASYWGAFGINPFEYIDGRGLFQAGLFSLISSIALLAIGAIVGRLLLGPVFPPGGGVNTPVGRKLAPLKRWLALANVVAIGLLIAFGPTDRKWFAIAPLVSLFSIAIDNSPVLESLSSRHEVRSIISFLLIFIPIFAIGYGATDARLIHAGMSRLLVDPGASTLPASQSFSGDISYVGKLGDSYVLYEVKSSSVAILQAASVPQLVLKRRALAANPSLVRP